MIGRAFEPMLQVVPNLAQQVLHPQSERELSNWNAHRKVTTATRAHMLAGSDAADAALVAANSGELSHPAVDRLPLFARLRSRIDCPVSKPWIVSYSNLPASQ